MRNYLGPYNKNQSRVYGRVKVRTLKTFEDIKSHIVPWLCTNLHWIKKDYIQAKRISNIGLLKGTYNAINLEGTRASLEAAVNSEIGREVKLDLRMRRTKCKSLSGRTVTTNILGVAVDSRQVSEAVKGIRAVLNKNVLPPTG